MWGRVHHLGPKKMANPPNHGIGQLAFNRATPPRCVPCRVRASLTHSGSAASTTRAVGDTMEPRTPLAPLTQKRHRLTLCNFSLATQPSRSQLAPAVSMALRLKMLNTSQKKTFHCALPAQVGPGGRLLIRGSTAGDCAAPSSTLFTTTRPRPARRGTRNLRPPRKKEK